MFHGRVFACYENRPFQLKHVFFGSSNFGREMHGRGLAVCVCLHDENLGSLKARRVAGKTLPRYCIVSSMANHMVFVFDGLLQYRLWVSGQKRGWRWVDCGCGLMHSIAKISGWMDRWMDGCVKFQASYCTLVNTLSCIVFSLGNCPPDCRHCLDPRALQESTMYELYVHCTPGIGITVVLYIYIYIF